MTLFTKGNPNGVIRVPLGWRGAWRTLTFYGGPYDNYPGRDKMFGVCVREENVPSGGYDVLLPIKDFKVPKDESVVRVALRQTLQAAVWSDRTIYIGCMGGWGRTGLFMALLAKALEIPEPISFIRDNYTAHAVETKLQEKYVQDFVTGNLLHDVHVMAWQARVPLFPRPIA